MNSAIAKIKPFIPLDKPLVLVGVLLGVILAGYAGFLGFRYLDVSARIASASAEIQALDQTRPPVSSNIEAAARLELAEAELRAVTALYEYPESDDLVAAISATATATGVWVERISIGGTNMQEQDGITYMAQPMQIAVRGPVEDTSSFLTLLYETVPVVEASNVSIADLQGDPLIQMSLVFRLFPESENMTPTGVR